MRTDDMMARCIAPWIMMRTVPLRFVRDQSDHLQNRRQPQATLGPNEVCFSRVRFNLNICRTKHANCSRIEQASVSFAAAVGSLELGSGSRATWGDAKHARTRAFNVCRGTAKQSFVCGANC